MTAVNRSVDGDHLALVGDIGGTNCRLALARNGELLANSLRVCAVADFATLADAVSDYLAARSAIVGTACLAIAGPIDGDRVRLTNHSWDFSIARTRSELGLRALLVVNDFEAIGFGLARLRPAQLQQIGGAASAAGAKVVLGPGTGFGAAVVIERGGALHVLPTEAGHISLAPCNERELELCRWLLRENLQITCEQLLSGPGLRLLHRALADIGAHRFDTPPAAAIVQCALAGDPFCAQVLQQFCELLGTAARDQALSSLARGGVYIAGGIVQRFLPLLRESGFRARFEDSGAMRALLQPIPVYVIADASPGLIGAAARVAQIGAVC